MFLFCTSFLLFEAVRRFPNFMSDCDRKQLFDREKTEMAAPVPAVAPTAPLGPPTLKGSRTEKNLAIAFAGESMARNRYTYFANVARKQGCEQIAAIFLETAENEREHAKTFLKLMACDGTPIHVQTSVAGVPIGKTAENLRAAADGELEEHSELYPHMAAVAEQEGFDGIAKVYRAIAAVEREHEQRFRLLLKHIEEKTLFKREVAVKWKCRNCGYVFTGTQPPAECPSCGHERGWFEQQEVLE
jgi:rubrerythrin